ncbi:MAG: hypothetical protein K6G47_07850, partial [Clostridia bacterium]|nr:hypothetical protein [Clostridia bacterium]
MRKLRSIALSMITVILFAVFVPLLAPSLNNKVNAAGEIVEVGSYDSLINALNDNSITNPTIKLTSSIKSEKTIYVKRSVTLDLDGHTLEFADGKYLYVDNINCLTITGNGYIIGNYSTVIWTYSDLIIDYCTVINKNLSTGLAIDSQYKNITIYNGTFISSDNTWTYDRVRYSCYRKTSTDPYTGLITDVFCNLQVAGNIVDRNNCNDILGDGVFCYDFENKTLHINGICDYDSEKMVIGSFISDLIIDIQGPSSLTGFLELNEGATIKGNNKLIISNDNPDYSCILAKSIMIRDVYVECQGKSAGIVSYDGTLTIENALINDKSEKGSIYFENGIFNLIDCKIIEPVNAVVGYDTICMENGTDIATKVVIQPDNMWGPIEYTWSDDYSKCTAKHICLVDPTMI